MKRLLCFVCMALVWGAVDDLAAQRVSTVPQKRAVLLEEYTGMKCGNCPDGAEMASALKELRGDAFYVIAVHGGWYAEPGEGYPDYRTDFGDTLLADAGADFFPSGSISRRPYGQPDPALSRSLWTKATKLLSAQDAEVNLYAQAVVDFRTRELTVDVEYCYPNGSSENMHLLNVALVQNHVVGYQNGGGQNYSHEHMLRHLLTGQWGEEIMESEAGKVYTRRYTYVLPEEIRGIDLEIRDIELVVFMAEGRREVMNVTGCKPEINGLEEDPDAEFTALALPDRRYGYDFFPVKVRNKCNDTISRISFVADINGVESEIEAEVCILPYQTGICEIPVESYGIQSVNTAVLTPSAINGQTFEAEALSYVFEEPVKSGSRIICIEMKTDRDGDEVAYRVRNRKGEILYRNGPFEAGKQSSINDTVALPEDGIYVLEFSDAWHDGWLESPSGFYKVRDGNGRLIGQNYSITGSGDCLFLDLKEEVAANTDNTLLQPLSVAGVEGGFRIANPSSLRIEKVSVYGADGRCLKTETIRTETDVWLRFQNRSTRICIVEVKTAAGTRFFKLLKTADR